MRVIVTADMTRITSTELIVVLGIATIFVLIMLVLIDNSGDRP